VRLLSIELQGFKSFADRTKISFNEGINAIVGPNGCGKSNIVDAFTWVLGEQSAKSLRADKMIDVIFAGTKSRKAVNFAEVTLIFSNEDGRLHLPVKEVAITRRLYRSGESEYLINKKAARLKDLHELFLHTGLGKEAFAVIGQGRVEEEIAQSSFERRKIFDELSGISRPLLKRKETLDRLRKSTENVEKAKIRFDEIYRQLEELKNQAEVAKTFEEKKEQLGQFKQLLASKRKHKFQAKFHDLNTRKAALEAQKDERSASESSEFREVSALKEQVEISWKTLSTHTQELERINGQKNLVQQMLQQLDDKLKKTSFRQNQIAQECAKAKKLHQELDGEQSSLSQQYQALEKKLREEKGQWEKLAGEQKKLEESFNKQFVNVKSAQSALVQQERLKNSKQVSCDACAKGLEEIKNKLEGIAKEHKELIRSSPDTGEFEQLKKEQKKQTDALSKLRSALVDLNKNIVDAEDGLKSIRSEKMQRQTARLSTQTKLLTLEGLRREHIGLDAGVKKLLEQNKNLKSPLYNKLFLLADILKEDKKFLKNTDIESFSAVFSSFLVVETVEDLELLIETCSKLKVQQFHCFCLKLLGMSREAFCKWITTLPTVDAISQAKGSGYVIVKGGKLIREGIITGFGNESKNPLVLDGEIETLSGQVKVLIAEEEKVTLQEKEKSSAFDDLIQKRRTTDQEMRSLEVKLLEINKQSHEFERKSLGQSERIRILERESQRLQDSLDPQKKELKKLGEELEEAEKLLQNSKNELIKQESLSKKIEKEREGQSERLLHAESAYREVERAHRECERKVVESSSRLKRTKEEIDRLELETKQITSNLDNSEDKREPLFKEVLEKQELHDEYKARLDRLKTDAEEKKRLLKEKEELVAAIREQLESIRNEHLQVSKELVSVEAELEKVKDAEAVSSDVLDKYKEMSESKLSSEIQKLDSLCSDASQINFRAIQDYETLKGKQNLCGDELQDLESSHLSLLELVQQIESDAEDLFRKTFEQVRQAFQLNFSKLFGGGDADLLMVESDTQDPFSRGVEIIAKPPGKDMRTLQLLSGGEKTMTAFALLMAFFQVRPSPCCILDEVDAPLDEANVLRFTDLLRSFSAVCQFLLITHNKKTMATCEHLVGVSMEQKGISTVLQLQLVN